MKHDGVPVPGVLGGRSKRGDGGRVSRRSRPPVGLAWPGLTQQDTEDVGGPVGADRQALGPELEVEVDVRLREAEGGVGSSLEENKGHSQITLFLELKPFVYR